MELFCNHRDIFGEGLVELIDRISQFYNQRLWHQLTEELLKYINLPEFKQPHPAYSPISPEGNILMDLYHNFIKTFEDKINPTKLIIIARRASKELSDLQALNFLTEIQMKIMQLNNDQEATIISRCYLSQIYVNLQDLNQAFNLLSQIQKEVEKVLGMDQFVHSTFHYSMSYYHYAKSQFELFYRHSLIYLSYTPIDQVENPQELAIKLGLTVLSSTSIYNFTELLVHQDLLNFLNNEKDQWLNQLLQTFNTGDLIGFQQQVQQHQQIILSNNLPMDLLQTKIRVLALMEIAFQREKSDRIFVFQEIAQSTQIEEDRVEFLVMRAMRLGLIKGFIDQIQKKVAINWVQPRVLDLGRIAVMRDRINNWIGNVHTIIGNVDIQSQALFS